MSIFDYFDNHKEADEAGWKEFSKVICEDHTKVAECMAKSYKDQNLGAWRDKTTKELAKIFEKVPEISKFINGVKNGDKVEAWMCWKDFLAAGGGFRTVRNEKAIDYCNFWIS